MGYRFRKITWVILGICHLWSCTTSDLSESSVSEPQAVQIASVNELKASFVRYDEEVEFTPIESYPAFSWDHVNTQAHFHIIGARNLTEQEAEFLANTYSFVTLAKYHGDRANIGSDVEISIAGEMLKKYNPDIKVIMYRSGSDYGAAYSSGSILNRPEYEYWMRWNEEHTEYNESFDYRIEEAREYMKESVAYFCRKGTVDGMYMDSYGNWNDGVGGTLMSDDEYNNLRECAFQMFREFVEENPGTITLGNSVCSRNIPVVEEEIVLDHVSGAMIDHFANYNCADAASIATDIEIMLHAVRKKKIITAKTWPRYDTDNGTGTLTYEEMIAAAREDIIFPLACFLMGAGDYSYFCYSWQWDISCGALVDYPEYHKPLGKPLGDFVSDDNWNYYREFEHATAWANLETGEAEIIWDVNN